MWGTGGGANAANGHSLQIIFLYNLKCYLSDDRYERLNFFGGGGFQVCVCVGGALISFFNFIINIIQDL